MAKLKTKNNSNKKRIIISCASIFAVILLVIAIVLPIVLRRPDIQQFKIPEIELPEDEMFALTKYKYDELSDSQTTVRADSMSVTKRGLARPEMTEDRVLSDDFSIVYNETTNSLYPVYESYTAKSNEKVASISFNPDNYPAPYYKKASATTNVYTEAINAINAGITDSTKKISEADYFAYYKYMYMTQGQHLAHQAARMSAETGNNAEKTQEFINWLKKHPSADGQYGAVKGTNNAVEKVIVLDPLYRSLHTTGLYLPAGEPVTIKVEGLQPGERIGITLGSNNTLAWRGSVSGDALTSIGKNYNNVNYLNNTSDYFFKQADLVTAYGKFFDYNRASTSTPFLQSQWARQNARAPWTSCDFTFSENKTYTFGFAFGGLIQINMGTCYSQAKVTITGAVETPHYILGVTSPEYFDTYLKNAPGVIAALDTENGILTGPTGELDNPYCNYMRTVKKEEIDKLAMLWHSFLSVNESFTGGIYNRHNKIMFDWHVPAGAAVSLGNYSFAQPTGWFGDALNYQKLLISGTWGTLHEIGHNHASAYGVTWGFATGQEGEVRNNALTLLSYIMFTDVGTNVRNGGGAEHGTYADPYKTLTETLANKGKMSDFNQAGYWRALGMYSNIMHSFGAEKFYELLYTYKTNPSYFEVNLQELLDSVDNENISQTEKDNKKQQINNGVKRADFAYRCSVVYGMNFLSYFNNFYGANITDNLFTDEQLSTMKALPNYNPVSSLYAGGIDGVKTSGDYKVTFGADIEFDLLKNTISTLDTGDNKGFEILSVSNPAYGTIKNLGNGKYLYSFNPNYGGLIDNFTFKVKLKDGVIHELSITLRISYSALSTYNNISTPNNGGDVVNKIALATPEVERITTSGIPAYQVEEGQNVAKKTEYYWRAPKTGSLKFSFKYNKTLHFYFGDSFKNIASQGYYSIAKPDGIEFNKKFDVVEGKTYAIRLINYNDSGEGFVNIFYKYDGEEAKEISVEEMLIPTSDNVTLTPYQYEPVFLVSKKSNVKLSVTGTDKSEWQVIKAPKDIHGGRIIKETQYVIRVDENGNEIKDSLGNPIRDPYTTEIDKWNYLIDGETGTYLHTSYSGKYTPLSEQNPHEFIIDLKHEQDINFFSVTTRNNVNSYIEKYDLYLGTDNVEGGYNWKQIVTDGTRKDYVSTTITKKFDTQKARYLRLVVKKTSGGGFSVLSEINAGIESPIQKLITASSSKLFTTKGWTKSSNLDSEPNGYIIANSRKQKAVIKFTGNSISLYAATGKGYGNVTIKIDGKVVSNVDLNHQQADLRKLIYYGENLSNKEHTMEVITNNSGKVMLGIIGLPYTGTLLTASNIYLEQALTIALVIFICLFIIVTALLLCLLFIPKFRHFMGNNKAIAWLDRKMAENKLKRQEKKKAKKEAKQKQKELEATNKDTTKSKSQPKPVKTQETATKNKTTSSAKEKSSKAKKSTNLKETKKPASKPQTKTTNTKKVETKKPNNKNKR